MSVYANSLPLFFSVCQNIADSNPKVRYLCAVDDSKNSLEDIVKVTVVIRFSNVVLGVQRDELFYCYRLSVERLGQEK